MSRHSSVILSLTKNLSLKSLLIILVFLLIPIVLLLRLNQKPIVSSAAWFNDSWQYRQRVDVANNTGTTQVAFPVQLNIGTSALIAAGKMKADCSDLRITDNNGKLLPFFISNCNETTTYFWAKVDVLIAPNTTLFAYYGNPQAANLSNAQSTFDIAPETITTASSAYSQYVSNVSFTTSTGENGVTPLASNYMLKFVGTNTTAAGNHYAYYKTATPVGDYLKNYVIQAGDYLTFLAYGYSGPSVSAEINFTDGAVLRGTHPDQDNNDIQNTSSHSVGHWYWRYFDLSDRVGKTINQMNVQQEYDTLDVSWIAYYNNIVIRKYNKNIAAAAPAAEETSSGPIASWQFDTNSLGSSFPDSSSSKIGLPIIGATAPVLLSEDQCVSGKCIQFPGNGSYLRYTVPANSPLNIGSSDFTLESWVKIFQPQNYGSGIFGQYSHNTTLNGRFVIGISDDRTSLFFHQRNSAGNIQSYLFTYTPYFGQWTHLAYVKSGTKLYLYLNGQLTKTFDITVPFDINFNGGYYYISHTGWAPGSMSNLTIDDHRIYKYARTPAQIAADYSAGKAHSSTAHGVAANLGSSNKNSDAFSSGLVGYWKMDENVGTSTTDSSGNNYMATFATGSSAPSWSNGKYGVGLSFNSVGTYSSAPINGTSLTELTYSFYFNIGTTSGYAGIMQWATALSSGSPAIYVRRNGSSIDLFNSGSYSTPITVTPNSWHLFTATYKNSITSIYIDGNLGMTFNRQLTSAYLNNATILYLGNGYNGYFDGLLDEVRIYNRALSPAEVSQLYNYAPGPVGYWKFDEGTGTTAFDSSGNNINASWSGTGSHWTQGKYGQAGIFNGSNDYTRINDNSLLSPESGNYTMQAWVKTNASYASSVAWIFANYGSAANNLTQLVIGTDNKLICGFRDTSGNIAQVKGLGSVLNDGLWHFVSCTKSGTSIAGYVDSLQVGTTVNSSLGTISTIGLAKAIGTNAGSIGTQNFTGSVDEVKIYNYARTQKQIVEDMNGGHPVGGSPVGSQVGYWKFDEGYGNVTQNWGNAGVGLSAVFGTGNSAPSWTNDGKFGKALNFNYANNNYLNTGDSVQPSEITITAWIKPSTMAYQRSIVERLNGFGLRITNGDKLTSVLQTTSKAWAFAAQSSQSIPQNQWTYVATTYTSGLNKLYINGVVDGTSTAFSGNLSYTAGQNLWIGAYSMGGGGGYFSGTIDEVKIYNSALTDDEIKIDYNNGKSIVMGSLSSASTGNTAPPTAASQEYCVPGDNTSCAPPIRRWDFNENTGTTAYDTSGNNSNVSLGTGNSAPTWTIGKIGTALNFDGSNDYATGFTSLLDNITISAWINSNSPGGLDNIFGGAGILCYPSIYSSKFQVYDNVAWRSTTTTIQPNTWYFVTLSFANSTKDLKLYINGNLEYSGTGLSTFTTSSISTIGSYGSGVIRNFHGKIDQIKIYDYIRTPAQIAWDYNRGKPIAWYKMDECQGSTVGDWSMNGNTGNISIGPSGSQTILGTCSAGTSAAWTNGALGRWNSSLNFDGIDDYVDIGTAPTIAGSFNTTTISAWINVTGGTGTWRAIVSPADSHHFHFQIRNNNMLEIYFYGPGIGTISTTLFDSSNYNKWFHIVGIWDGAYAKLYINGKLESQSTAGSGTISAATTDLTIGRGYGPGRYFSGQIDDVRIYNYALTSEQVKQVYNNGSVVNYAPVTGSP